MGLSSIKSNLPSPQASTDENHETPFSLARQQPPVRTRGPPVSFTGEHCTNAHPIRGVRGNTKVSRIPRRQGRSKASRTKGMRIPPTGIPCFCQHALLESSNAPEFRTQRSNKKNRHGKFRALHGGDSDDGDDMAKKLTMEIKKFSLMTAQQNQNFQPTNPEYQNSPTLNVDKP